MTDLQTIAAHLRDIHESFAQFMVWGLMLVVVALTAIVGNLLVEAGIMDTAAARGLRTPLALMVIVAMAGWLVGFAGYFLGIVAELRDSEDGDSV